MQQDWRKKAETFDWDKHRGFLQKTRYRPLFVRAFGRMLREKMDGAFAPQEGLKLNFLSQFDTWLCGSKLNSITGLEAFPHRDFISGVTHALDDLHIIFGQRLVAMEKEYAYHRRMKPQFPLRTLETLRTGDILVMGAPFAHFGDLHPQTKEILDQCLQLDIPVHIDAAWFGCMRGFTFNYDHPAILTVSFSLSKGLGLGSHRAGVRYSRHRHAGPVSIVNDFGMEVNCVMACGIQFMKEFGSDYLQARYGEAYLHVCEKLHLRPTKAIHMAYGQEGNNEWQPMGIRPFLRYLVDDLNEFS